MSEDMHIPELQKLKELSERLVSPELAARINDELPDALVVTTEEGKIVVFNRQAELMFGYSRLEVFGKPVEMLIPPSRREAHVSHRSGYAGDPRSRPMGSAMLLEAQP